MRYRSNGRWALMAVVILVRPVWATAYRLQITHLDDRNFSAHLEHSTPARSGEEGMAHLEEPGYGGEPLAWLAVCRPPVGRQGQEVPEISYNDSPNAVDRRTFVPWLERNAQAMHGMSIVVGLGRNPH